MSCVSSGEDELLPFSRKRRLLIKEPAPTTIREEEGGPPSLTIKPPPPKISDNSGGDTQSPASKRRRVNTVVEGSSDTEAEDGTSAPTTSTSGNKSQVYMSFTAPKKQHIIKQPKSMDDNLNDENSPQQLIHPYETIKSLRVDRIFGCRFSRRSGGEGGEGSSSSIASNDDDDHELMLSTSTSPAEETAIYLVKWEDRSYRELCWVKYDDLIEEHDAEAKIMKFHRKNEYVYLADLLDSETASVDEAIDKRIAIVTKSRQFTESGGWRVPRVSIPVSASDQGNFLLFSKVDRIIGFRLKRRKTKSGMKVLKEYLVKWNLQGYDAATWESELVLCGRGGYESLYGLALDEDLRGSYQFYFNDDKLKGMKESEIKAIQQYEKSNQTSKPLRKVQGDPSASATSYLEGFEYQTNAVTDNQGSTTLWQLFLEEKLGEQGMYKPSMKEDGQCRSLLAHQQEGLKWLFYNAEKTGHGSLLADEMGLGKTCQSVVYLQHILDVAQRKPNSPASHALVVLQKSTLENWKREFSLWAPNLNVVAFCGSKVDRNAVLEWEVSYHNLKDGSVRRDVANPLRPDVILVTYESIRSAEFRHLLPPKYKWTSVVVDECQKAKGGYSSVLRSTLERLPRENMVLLSGTPVQNSVKELFPLLSLLHPTRFSYDENQASRVEYTESSFLEAFGNIQDRDDCVEVTEKLQALLRPYILRREKSQVLKALPPKLVKLIKVPLTMIQKKVYQAIYRRTAKLRVSGLQMQLRKVCIHPFMVDSIEEMVLAGKFGQLKYRPRSPAIVSNKPTQNEDPSIDPTPTTRPDSEATSTSQSPLSNWEVNDAPSNNDKNLKTDQTPPPPPPPQVSLPDQDMPLSETADRELQILLQCSGKFILIDKMLKAYRKRGQKVLLFSYFKTALDLIQYYAELMGWVIERIDGDTTGEDRQICIDRFNTDPERFLFLCTTRAGGLGVNLTSASVVIHLDSDYNPQHDLQAQARCHRIGQNRNVEVYHLVAEDTYENYILFDIAGRKLGLEQVLLGRLQASTGVATVQKKKMSKHQEEVALKKGVYAALRDDAKTAEEEEAFTNLSIEHILAQKTEIVSEDQDPDTESERLPSAFSTARFEEAVDDDLERSSFWDDVQSQLDKIADVDNLDETSADGHSSSGIPYSIREARRKRFNDHTTSEKGRSGSASDSSNEHSDPSDDQDIAEEDDADYQVAQNAVKHHPANQQQQSNDSTMEAKPAIVSSMQAPVKATRRSTGPRSVKRDQVPVNMLSSQSSDATTQEDGRIAPSAGRVSIGRKRRSRAMMEGSASLAASHTVSKVDEQALGAAIRLTATLTQPSSESVTRVCEYLEQQNLPHLSRFWRENIEKRDSISPLRPAENLPAHARIYDLVYRCLCGIEAWTKTPFGTANGIKSEHLRWIDQFSPWGLVAMHDAALRVLDASCNPNFDSSELTNPLFRISQVTQTFFKEFLGALMSWEASCQAWELGSAKFQELIIEEYARRADEKPSLFDGGRQWYDHGNLTEEMVYTVVNPIVNEIFGDQIGHREGGSRRQTWIPAEDVVAKFIFMHLAIGIDLKPLTCWPPPGDEVDWTLVSQVVGRVSRLADGPERRRDAVLNRYYNRLDSRWNDEPFTEEERNHLVAGFHSKAQPATIARQLCRRNLEKVKKGLRCIQLQVAAGEKKRKSAGEYVQPEENQSPISSTSVLPLSGLEEIPLIHPLPTPAVVVSSTAPILLEEMEENSKGSDDVMRASLEQNPADSLPTNSQNSDAAQDVSGNQIGLITSSSSKTTSPPSSLSADPPSTGYVSSSSPITHLQPPTIVASIDMD